MLLFLAAFVFFRCVSSQGIWRKAPSCVGSQRLLAAYSFCCCESLFSVRVSSFPLSSDLKECSLVFFEGGYIRGCWGRRADVAAPLHAHSVRGVATPVSFLQNWSISRCWRPQLGDRTQCSLLFIFATFRMFLKDCGPLVRFLLRATLLTPRNFFWALFNSRGFVWRWWFLILRS